jgi:hypothetical protein
MNSVIRLSDFVASGGSSVTCVEAEPCELHAPQDMAGPVKPEQAPDAVIDLPDLAAPVEDVAVYAQADIDAAEARGRAQVAGNLDDALKRHAEAVEQMLAAAARQIEDGVAEACADLLMQVCKDQAGRRALQQLVADAQTCLSQLADNVEIPVLVVDGEEELAEQLESLLNDAGLKARRVSASERKDGAEREERSADVLKLHVGDSVIEALVGKWRRDLQDCLQ